MAKLTNAEIAKKLAEKIAKQVEKAAGEGLNAARVFITSRVKETLSTPAPRRRFKSSSGDFSYVATTRATPGAPPRKLSGRLRSSIYSSMLTNKVAVIGANARSDGGYNYPKLLELAKGNRAHPFIRPTVYKYMKEIREIMGRQLYLGFKKA